tara:strand:+ start:216 stop:560 length:345 start_codon:yes stop_codon:yes gene_type:complete
MSNSEEKICQKKRKLEISPENVELMMDSLTISPDILCQDILKEIMNQKEKYCAEIYMITFRKLVKKNISPSNSGKLAELIHNDMEKNLDELLKKNIETLKEQLYDLSPTPPYIV